MIPEREREALMRLTMCAREDCGMCKYEGTCDFDFQYETATRCMNILADALRTADRKTEPFDKDTNVRSKDELNSSEKPNNCEPKICDTCRHYNSNIPCGSTPSACNKADKFAEEFVDGLKKLKPKDEPQTERSSE